MASKTKDKSFLLRLLIIVFCAYILITLGALIKELSSSRETLAATKQQAKQTADQIEEKKNLLDNSSPKELLERAARECGWVYPNENVIIDVNN